MTEVNGNKLPIWFWICTIILVLWGLMGMYVYYDFVTMTPETIADYVSSGSFTQAYADSLANTPMWATSAFALAVFTGALGALCLLLRKRWAALLYTASLIFIVISLADMFLIRKLHTMMSGGQIGMEGVVLLLGLFAFWFARKGKANGWLK